MKVSGMLCVSVLALAMLAPAAAFAAVAKSSTTEIESSDAASKACTDKGGIVTTASGGQKSCTVPAAACIGTKITTGKSSSIDIDDPAAVRACFDVCGTISTNDAGQKVCTKPPTLGAPAPTTAREPHN